MALSAGSDHSWLDDHKKKIIGQRRTGSDGGVNVSHTWQGNVLEQRIIGRDYLI